eukprot:COSAG02_NODE_3098_length_7378_cov_4.737189_2_plen_86_part_00
MHRTNDLEWSEVVALVDNHAPVIINVMDGAHFVLVVGYDKPIGGDTLFVNDPGFNRPSCVSSLGPPSPFLSASYDCVMSSVEIYT